MILFGGRNGARDGKCIDSSIYCGWVSLLDASALKSQKRERRVVRGAGKGFSLLFHREEFIVKSGGWDLTGPKTRNPLSPITKIGRNARIWERKGSASEKGDLFSQTTKKSLRSNIKRSPKNVKEKLT